MVARGEEMFNAMIRTSMSPIIYETTDFAVGATDAKGNLLAQGNGVTAFLATLDTAVVSLLEHYPDPTSIRPGDVFISNTPYEGGGTHLSDVVIRSEEHTSELQSLMRISYAVFCLKKKRTTTKRLHSNYTTITHRTT